MQVSGKRWRTLAHILWFLLLALHTGCHRLDSTKRTVVATSEKWRVTLIGDLHTSGVRATSHVIAFDVERFGKPYANGELFRVGPHDQPFMIEYPKADWAAPNTVRFWRVRPHDALAMEITLLNEADIPIKWLRLRTDELFVAFDLPSQNSVTVSTLRWGDPAISLVGEFENSQPIRAVSESVGSDWKRVRILVRQNGAAIMRSR